MIFSSSTAAVGRATANEKAAARGIEGDIPASSSIPAAKGMTAAHTRTAACGVKGGIPASSAETAARGSKWKFWRNSSSCANESASAVASSLRAANGNEMRSDASG